ncbi:Lrp/AsnC family transcriptional regulator [Conchiformibius steedae DSM 2580]|uniref:Lrp/AsnC family transcriptional regulator n=1 Tax=Conchiformibius steedae DSM 2580 TaxID=1121352 RepID=A0AAE9KYF6_9NEIS|nr:Lrp/AsnC family transcriptional regulator [Conchiformibius steedae]URD66683.1 Lrp/AsnC family transcriptional regulator [Conchiformibius steedae DSM 2580]
MNLYPLDALDRRILNLLQDNADMPLKDLAEQCHASAATCQRRLARLKQNGMVKSVALVSPQAAGCEISVFVQIQLEHQDHLIQGAFEAAVRREPEVAGCYEISGDYDFMLLVHCRDMHAYHRFTRRVLGADNRVRTFKSLFIMNFVKAETKIKL